MGKPAAKNRSQRQKSDLNGNLSKHMKKGIKKEKVPMNYPLVATMDLTMHGVEFRKRIGSGYECQICFKLLNHWNIAVNADNWRYHIEVRYTDVDIQIDFSTHHNP